MKWAALLIVLTVGCSGGESTAFEAFDGGANEDAGLDAAELDSCAISDQKDPPICEDAGAKP